MRLIYFLIISLYVFNTNAQNGFSTVVPHPQPGFHPYDAIVDNDSIIWYGNSFSDSITFPQVILTSKCDSNGNFINSTLSSDSAGGRFATYYTYGEIVKDSNFYVTTAGMVGRTSAFLFKFDNNLNEVLRKEYPDTINISNFRYKIINAKGGYLLFGSIQKPNLDICAFVRYVDKQGEVIWHKFIDMAPYQAVITQGIAAIDDSTFIVTCSLEDSKIGLLVFDLEGNDIKSWISESDPDVGASRKIIDAKNGYLIYGMSVVEIIGTTKIGKPTFTKMDTAFNIEWITHINVRSWSFPYQNLFDFELAPNGDILAAGAISVRPDPNEPSEGYGWLLRYSSTGDSMWGLHIPPPAGMEKGELTSVGQLSSGSIVGMGTAFSPTGRAYAWLVKVTPDGCLDTSLCATVGTLVTQASRPEIFVYPNPFQEKLFIACPPNASIEGCSIQLVNSTGRIVLDEKLNSRYHQFKCQQLPNGFYFYQIRNRRGVLLKSGKVIKKSD